MITIRRDGLTGGRPWDSIDASYYMWLDGKWVPSDLPHTPQREIDKCLYCSRADCIDCIGTCGLAGRPRAYERDIKIVDMYTAGIQVSAIASAFGIDRATVYRAVNRAKGA